jgi:hypothetical protein
VNRLGRGAFLCGLHGLLTLACGHTAAIQRQALPDGRYRVDCTLPLVQCLQAIEEVCKQGGYEIVQAHEDRRLAGPRDYHEPTFSSQVIARCRQEPAMFRGSPAPTGAGDAAPPPAVTRSCFPGTTQACLGAGACKGAQSCLPDGAAFGACDCGAAGPAEPSVDATAPK